MGVESTSFRDQVKRKVATLLCGFRKYTYPPHGWLSEILRGLGSQKQKFF